MKINIVTEQKPGWVLRWISESYAKYIPNTKVSTTVDESADINLYINYDLFQKKSKTIDIGYFTHKEMIYSESAYEGMSIKEKNFAKDMAKRRSAHFDSVAKEVDWCISMNKGLLTELPKNRSSVALVPPDPQFMKDEIVIGLVGKFSKTGRKRLHWIDEINSIEGITIKATEGKYKWEDLPLFYKSIDYLLIFAENEGGPLPLVEALAMGVPVIANDVGFVSEYTSLRFKDLKSLKDLLKGLIIKKNAWEIASKEMISLFKNLIRERNKKASSRSFLSKFLKKD